MTKSLLETPFPFLSYHNPHSIIPDTACSDRPNSFRLIDTQTIAIMRFTFLLAALPAIAFAQDLDSLLSEASAILTNSNVQSYLSEASSYLDNASVTSLLGSITSAYASDIASITSEYGTGLASATSALGSAASDAAATASAAEASEDSVDRVLIPAMGMVGAGVLGLAAFL